MLPAVLSIIALAAASPLAQPQGPPSYSGVCNTPAGASLPTAFEIPPTDSEAVKRWVSQIDWSLVPDIKPNAQPWCDASTDPENVANAEANCWWSCNGCLREDDVSTCPNKGAWGLTFDDGPTAGVTLPLLDELAKDNTKATFFIIGSQVVENPEILSRTVAEGHEVGVHTWSHPGLTTLTNEQIVAELGWAKEIMGRTIGCSVPITLMRPPFGDMDDRVRAISRQMNQRVTPWTRGFDINDWRLNLENPDQQALEDALETMIQETAPGLDTGFITLQHDTTARTLNFATDVVLPRFKAAGYKPLSLAQCGA